MDAGGEQKKPARLRDLPDEPTISRAIAVLCLGTICLIGSGYLLARDIQVGRYASVIAAPTESQANLLSNMVRVKFPSRVKTVGGAVRHLLSSSGYRLYRPHIGFRFCRSGFSPTLLGFRQSRNEKVMCKGYISPLEVLDIHARDEAESRRYAELWAQAMGEDAERILAFQRAYVEAGRKLYPGVPLIDPNRLPEKADQTAGLQPSRSGAVLHPPELRALRRAACATARPHRSNRRARYLLGGDRYE